MYFLKSKDIPAGRTLTKNSIPQVGNEGSAPPSSWTENDPPLPLYTPTSSHPVVHQTSCGDQDPLLLPRRTFLKDPSPASLFRTRKCSPQLQKPGLGIKVNSEEGAGWGGL